MLILPRVDYIIAPLKILQSLKDSITYPDEKYSYVRRLSPGSAMLYNFSEEEVILHLIFISTSPLFLALLKYHQLDVHSILY